MGRRLSLPPLVLAIAGLAFCSSGSDHGHKCLHSGEWMKGPLTTSQLQESGVLNKNEHLPDDTFVCRAHHGEHLIPGKSHHGGDCVFPYEGGENATRKCDFIKSETDMEWVSARNGDLPDGAMVAGFDNGWPAVVCRGVIFQENRTILASGKLLLKPGATKCLIPRLGEASASEYEVLVHADKKREFVTGTFFAASFGSHFNQSEAVTFMYSQDREHVSVCRVRVHQDVIVPGKYMPSQNKCFVPLAEEQSFSSYEILIKTPDMGWQLVRRGETPEHAILAGYEDGYPVLVCRTLLVDKGRQIYLPGKVTTEPGAGRGCQFPFHGVRDAGFYYEILVSNA